MKIFHPVIIDTLKKYDRRHFLKDVLAGVIVGIVALPLAIAFGVASGVSPEKGLITAIVAGFLISTLGGSRVQIGGPTGAFIVIVYGIVETYGVSGLVIATFLAGLMLVAMGIARLGSVIKYIPHPLIIGFTSGIAVVIFSSQLKDLLGLHTGALPADMIQKIKSVSLHISTANGYAIAIALITIFIILAWPKINSRIPGSLIALVVTTVVMQLLHLPVETIGSRFGAVSFAIPAPAIPHPDFSTLQQLVQPAFTIALLGGIESLLSAVVADGMTGDRHRSNTELIAQGTANIFSSLFGGIPATGAIARTATNIRNGAGTPVAGIVHALTLLLIMLFAARWAALIPMATLAGILVVVAYHMSEWKNFQRVLKGPRSDAAVLIITFLLTIFVDLTIAIEVGMLLAVFLFLHSMIKYSGIKSSDNKTVVPADIEVFEVTGPLFFGVAYKFKEAIYQIRKPPRVLIMRMGHVPVIDTTGIHTLEEVYRESRQRGIKLILSEVHSPQVKMALKEARLLFAIGKANVTDTFEEAVARSAAVIE